MNAWHNVRVGAVGDGLKRIEGKWWGCFSSSEVVIALPSRMMFGSGGDVWSTITTMLCTMKIYAVNTDR